MWTRVRTECILMDSMITHNIKVEPGLINYDTSPQSSVVLGGGLRGWGTNLFTSSRRQQQPCSYGSNWPKLSKWLRFRRTRCCSSWRSRKRCFRKHLSNLVAVFVDCGRGYVESLFDDDDDDDGCSCDIDMNAKVKISWSYVSNHLLCPGQCHSAGWLLQGWELQRPWSLDTSYTWN